MRTSRLAVLAALLLAACADDPLISPDSAPLMAPDAVASRMAIDATPTTTGNHLVVFRGTRIPGDLAERVDDVGARVVSRYDLAGAALVADLTPAGAAALRAERDVQYVEPEPILMLPEPAFEPEVLAADVEVEAGTEAPDDPAGAYFFARQWHLRAIQADMAWAAGALGSEDVTVAILDTGIDYMYPDLQGRVDLSRSISLRPEDDALVAAYFGTRNPITDLDVHGTHVASTVASNAYVNAGVTSKTTLIGVKVCSVYGGCTNLFEGIQYAVQQGANIINMSLGASFRMKDYPGYVSVLSRYANWARQNGTLVVVSAGNESMDLDRALVPDEDTGEIDHVPSLYKMFCDAPGVVCVSATGPTARESVNGPWTDVDAFAPYSNYGRSAIDVAAPGGSYGGSVYAACSQTSLVLPICQTGNYVVGMGGTSMAAPHVSGVAALIMATGERRPAQVKAILTGTADDLGQPGTDPYYGKGRVNAYRAIQ